MVGQYPKECSIVFIMNLISALFSYLTPFQHPFPPSIVARCIDLFVLQWSSDVTIVTACTDKVYRGWKGVISNTDKVKKCTNFAISHKTVGYKSKILYGNLYDVITSCGVA